METKSKQLDDWNLPVASVFTHSAQDSFRLRSPSTMPCFASSFAVAFSWNTTACSSIFLQCLKKFECTKNGHQWHETNIRFHPDRTFISKPFPPPQIPQQITTLKVDMQKSFSYSIGTRSSNLVFGHCSSSISLRCSKTLRVYQMGHQWHEKKGTHYLCRAFISKPFPPSQQLGKQLLYQFRYRQLGWTTWAWRRPKTFRVYQLDILDMGKNYKLSRQIFHLQTHRTLS